MKLLFSALKQLPEFQTLLSALESGKCPVAVSGLSPVHRAFFAAAVQHVTQRPVILLCADEMEGRKMTTDLRTLSGEEVLTLPARDFLFHNATVVSRQWEQMRLGTLWNLLQKKTPFFVASAEAVLQRTLPPEALRKASLTLRMDGHYHLTQLAETLTAAGYSRSNQVEGVGQFSIRGGILDFFSPAYQTPVRMELFGEEVDSMGFFDPISQRRVQAIEEAQILPTAETLPQLAPGGMAGLAAELEKKCAEISGNDLLLHTLRLDQAAFAEAQSFPAADRYMSLIYPQMATAVDYFPSDAIVFFSESPRFQERCRHYIWQMNQDVTALSENGVLLPEWGLFARTPEDLTHCLEHWPVCYLDAFSSSQYPQRPKTVLSVLVKLLPSYGVSLETAASDLSHYQTSGYSTVILAGSEQRCLNLQTLLREHRIRSAVDFQLHSLPKPGQSVICCGGLSAGMEFPEMKLAVLTEGQSAPVKKTRPRQKGPTNREKLKSYADLSPGDLVVHQQYGIGRYAGIVKMTVDGVMKDYVKISYQGADNLYVPATQLDQVSKYIGAGEEAKATKKLSKLGGTDWERQKSKAKKAVRNLAKGLISLYAERQKRPGFAFSPDSPWMVEFEEGFEYNETEDQTRCIAEIKKDMEAPRPMDRLLCGDVGYGKTEVAFRAIMKCILDGKQAAVLAPTTVLARQHLLTARQRFAKYPVEIEAISRFRTPAQIRETLRRVAAGQVDLLIGTHRLLQKDVKFKDLGLLVVDEEQRFGVTHKEKLKELARQVDVLTLSATPIPRTLNMALSGIRDMSVIEKPPQDRQPVQTYVMEHDWGILADAMRRELERGGQVYYLHNRVETISRVAAYIQEILGEEVSVGVAHGKMSQEELNDVMGRMSEGEVGVLVCTTIIETGIDIPNTNTLIIEDADQLGLAQLHQIRGRVGRSSRRAFAYLTYRSGKVLSEVAAKRLTAIREFAAFGSGFKIAMRDMEIRGAGNLLGPEQSGFLVSVGYDMYLRLLEEAILSEQGKELEIPKECSADLTISASIPEHYVPSPEERMDLYRRIALVRDQKDAHDLTDELIDRYGDPPFQVNNLIAIAQLRADAVRCGITDIAQRGEKILFSLENCDLARLSQLCGHKNFQGNLLLSAGEKPSLTLRLKKGENSLHASQNLIRTFLTLQESEQPAPI